MTAVKAQWLASQRNGISRLRNERTSMPLTAGRFSLLFTLCKGEGGAMVFPSSQGHGLHLFGRRAGCFTLKKMKLESKTSKYCSISFNCHKDEKDKLRLQLLFYSR